MALSVFDRCHENVLGNDCSRLAPLDCLLFDQSTTSCSANHAADFRGVHHCPPPNASHGESDYQICGR
ncbi:hypothetical protein CERZMDRAFT_91386 [Cercospora zeae-maydis SCOH1-5]|uniref:Uncharacterized protein n=1 Tax=Cercospora zeae-maydis SCOH1-5 TaxID=717836 RepID=A0A6A6F624_9PEZI|nr:hypothetical protein CERZMDRAFT_91386 [Cercospora zeae-maydis SCOH1-5]